MGSLLLYQLIELKQNVNVSVFAVDESEYGAINRTKVECKYGYVQLQ